MKSLIKVKRKSLLLTGAGKLNDKKKIRKKRPCPYKALMFRKGIQLKNRLLSNV